MNVILLRTNKIDFDPRVQKEFSSMLKLDDLRINALVWDRTENYRSKLVIEKMQNKEVPILQFGIAATWGGGMKKNFFPMIKFEWKVFWFLIRNIKKYDVVHACDLLTGLPAIIPVKLFKKKIVYDIFDYYADTAHGPKWLLSIFRKLEDSLINISDATIICSEKRKEQISNAKPKSLYIIHNSPSLSQLNCESNLEVKSTSGKTKIIYVGNLVEDRLIREMIEAVKPLDVELHIGGYGVLENYVKEESILNDNIYFYGKMPYCDVIALEKKCDIMIALYDPEIPNHKYAAPNKFYEALALGKPIIMIKDTGVDDVVEMEKIGVTCESTVSDIRRSVIELDSKRSVFHIISEKEKNLFNQKYSWEIMENRLISLYKRIGNE